MTKSEFKAHWLAMYRVGNRADSPPDEHEDWTVPAMAGSACCKLLDTMAHEMTRLGVFTEEEERAMYDSL